MRKKSLTFDQQIQIKMLYQLGGHSLRSLALEFGVSKDTISNALKSSNTPPQQRIEIVQPTTPAPQKSPLDVLSFEPNPIRFRVIKITQIEMDIENLSARGTNPATLYKLQIELHDQVTAMRKALGEIQGEESEEQLLMMLEQAVISLSPIQRESLLGLLGDDIDNVIPIRGGS